MDQSTESESPGDALDGPADLLAALRDPKDLRRLPASRLPDLAALIRRALITKVSATGGHLGPNLGVVELTIALHRVFNSPRDALVFDTGHQAYVHKMLTGRLADFATLRQAGGLSGYPSRAESDHDIVENSHASVSLSWADGIAKAWQQRGLLAGSAVVAGSERNRARVSGARARHVVAVIGDGALTGGMAWEALNNIASGGRQVVIVVNDNGRSYSPTIGGLATHLATLRTTRGYEAFLTWGKQLLGRTPVVGPPMYEALHGLKKGVKDLVAPQGLFEDLGLKYLGPVHGHDVAALEHTLTLAREYNGPVIVHVITEKGHGYGPAVDDEADQFHSVGVIDPVTGHPLKAKAAGWTSIFAEEMVSLGRQRPDVVAITAAMLGPTGLERFSQVFPDRIYDVGIAEQHAATSAAGLAFGGMHPVVAVYATFLNRAFDQVLMDCALHGAGVTFVLDRAGITGDDGASHNGVWDMAALQVVPGLHLAAPRDGTRLRELLAEAVQISDAPSVVRFPKGAVPADVSALERVDSLDVLHRSEPADVLLVAVGAFAGLGCAVAERLTAQGIGATVVDPRWVKPLPIGLVELAARHRLVVTVEDGVRAGGVGSAVSQLLRDHNVFVPCKDLGVPVRFLAHGTPAQVKAELGLTEQDVARVIVEAVSRLDAAEEASDPARGAQQRTAEG